MIRSGLVAALLLGAALPAAAEPALPADPVSLLHRIAASARQLNYSGVFVYQQGNTVQTSRIAHRVDDAGEHERIETLDGPPREVVRSNEAVACYFADRKVVKIGKRRPEKSFPALLPDKLGDISGHYSLKLLGVERVAGFECRELSLEPKDAMRFGHRLCAELGSGLLLRARTVSERGDVIEQFAFTQLTIGGEVAPEQVRARSQAAGWPREDVSASEGEAVDTGWTIGSPPPGFRKIMETRRTLNSRGVAVSHLVYSDGISAVSIFVEPMPAHRAQVSHGLSQQGAVNIFSKVVAQHLVTVLGEAPAATVMQFGNSVTQRGR